MLKLKVYAAREGGRKGLIQKKCVFKGSDTNSPDLNTGSAVRCCRLLLIIQVQKGTGWLKVI